MIRPLRPTEGLREASCGRAGCGFRVSSAVAGRGDVEVLLAGRTKQAGSCPSPGSEPAGDPQTAARGTRMAAIVAASTFRHRLRHRHAAVDCDAPSFRASLGLRAPPVLPAGRAAWVHIPTISSVIPGRAAGANPEPTTGRCRHQGRPGLIFTPSRQPTTERLVVASGLLAPRGPGMTKEAPAAKGLRRPAPPDRTARRASASRRRSPRGPRHRRRCRALA